MSRMKIFEIFLYSNTKILVHYGLSRMHPPLSLLEYAFFLEDFESVVGHAFQSP